MASGVGIVSTEVKDRQVARRYSEYACRKVCQMAAASLDVSISCCGQLIQLGKSQVAYLHPTLIALSIVLHCDEDLHSINQYHPDWQYHEFYKSEANFPKDISDLLPDNYTWKQI